jgi:hypothetical protein
MIPRFRWIIKEQALAEVASEKRGALTNLQLTCIFAEDLVLPPRCCDCHPLQNSPALCNPTRCSCRLHFLLHEVFLLWLHLALVHAGKWVLHEMTRFL